MAEQDGKNPNKLLQERSRLLLLTRLASTQSGPVKFNDLRSDLSFTSGNLSVHLKTLEEAGYVKIEKRFERNKPQTLVAVTSQGLDALHDYLNELESLVRTIREDMGSNKKVN